MNIGYTPRYSEIIRGLKQPSSIKDQDNKLIFTYPILCEKTVSSYLNDIRKFMSVSFLKELIVSNSINIIKLSSYVPGYGETEKTINAQATMINSMKGLNPLNTSQNMVDIRANMYNDSDLAQRKYELQNKITEKTAYIQQYLDTDPKLKSLLPYIEILTLNNFINVPVIVGTKGYPMDQVPLFLFMLGSLGLNKPLNSTENLSYIISEYKKYKPEEYWKILNSLESKQSTKQIFEDSLKSRKTGKFISSLKFIGKTAVKYKNRTDQYFADKINTTADPDAWSRIKRNARLIFTLGIGGTLTYNYKSALHAQRYAIEPSKIKTTAGTVQQIRDENNDIEVGNEILQQLRNKDMYTPMESLLINKLSNDKLKDAVIIWDKVLNPNSLKKEYGINFTKSDEKQASIISNTLPNYNLKVPILNKIAVDDIHSNAVGIAIKSMFNILGREFDRGAKDNEVLLSNLIYDLSDKIDIINKDYLKTSVEHIGKRNVTEVSAIINEIKNMQKIDIEELVDINNKLYNNIYKNQIYVPDFSYESFKNFMKMFEDINITISIKNDYYFKFIGKVLGENNTNTLKKKLNEFINESVLKYFNEVIKDGTCFDSFMFKNFQRYAELNSSPLSLVGDSFIKFHENVVNKFVEYIINMLTFYFILGCVSLLVDYVNYIEADIKAFDSDITSDYNYTLIVPLDLIVSLNAIIVAKTFKNILSQNMESDYSRINLAEPYVKGLIKYVYNNLGVPNLFVIDKKSDTIYYRMMYQSDIIKTNLNTIKTFVESNTKITLSSSNINNNGYF